ncbi:hypothetical protein [Achromobacter piechaudii]|uniref:hypothetical protein n=1 Tax=Achromobacter piechaudii TaxID=72556 RepID=UPI0015830795|nr:hypothetical protein [Achromobacter piechaudii]
MSIVTHQERRAIQSGNVTEPGLATRSPLPMSARAARFHNLRKIRQPDQRAPVAAAAWHGWQARRTSATNQRISASRKPLLPRKKESSSRRHARIDALVLSGDALCIDAARWWKPCARQHRAIRVRSARIHYDSTPCRKQLVASREHSWGCFRPNPKFFFLKITM